MTRPARINKGAIASTPADTVSVALVASDDERALVARIRAGDERAFEALFRAYYGGLWAFCAALIQAPDMAEECVQDVLWWVWENRARWIVRDGVRAYLYGAVRNRAVNVIKRRGVAARGEGTVAAEARAGAAQGPESGDERVRARELAAAVDRAVAAMPERRREAFTLRTRHQMTHPEIARVMGITVKSVEFHMARALAAVREAL
ncbi:MAG TPA: RNA polymerase sigma-70 factor, partial [Gemmatimonadaceae bacterium]|nr:RNA polymerase sigma-70 factor [Gemmatimonadaceae bacterium]